MKSYLIPRLRDILFLAVFIAAIALGPRMLNIDGDLPRHLLMGEIVLKTLSIHTTDVFSYVNQGLPIAPHEWLAGVIFAVFYILLGLNGVVIFAALLLATTFTLVYEQTLRHVGERLPVLFLVIWGAVISSLHWITRPHLFSMLFLALFLIWADSISHKEIKSIWMFPTLMLFWGNIHGEFIAGFLVLIAYGTGWVWDFFFNPEQRDMKVGKRLGLAFILSLFATFINPVGVRTWEVVLGYVNNQYLMSRINETNPPNFSQPQFLSLLGLLAFSIFLLATQKGRLSTSQAFALAGFSAMSLLSARNVHLYGVAAPFLLSNIFTENSKASILGSVEKLFSTAEKELHGFIWPIMTVVVIGALVISGVAGVDNRFEPTRFPVGAVDWLETHPQTGEMFNAFDWGGYILLRLWPRYTTFIDSQTDVTGNLTKEYETIITMSDGWQNILTRYDVHWTIIPPEWPLGEALKAAGWKSIYQDDTAAIYRK